MGNLNRAHNPNRNKAFHADQAKRQTSQHRVQVRTEEIEAAPVQAIFSRVKEIFRGIFRFFGFGFTTTDRGYHIAKFEHNIFHAPHHQGKRTPEQRERRKARRQKRTKLIQRRGWA